MKIIDFQRGLSFQTDSKNSKFYNQLKKILDFSSIPYFDPCCSTAGTDRQSVGFDPVTSTVQTFNGTTWVSAETGLTGLGNGTVAAPSMAFASDSDLGIYRVGTDQMGFSANGVLQTVIDTTGLKTASLVELVGAAGVAMTGKLVSDKGTVTQATSKTTTVVLNKPAGVITTVALTDAADTSFVFTLTNSQIAATSVVTFGVLNSGNGIVNVSLISIGSGTCVIRVANTGTAAFNSAINIHFTIS